MRTQAASWLDRVPRATSLPTLKNTIDAVIHQLGFQYFVYRGLFPNLHGAPDEIRIDTSPPAWRDHCLRCGIDSNWDPMHHRALQEVTPILWCTVRERHSAFFDDARRFGIATGVTQPLHGPGGQWSSISFIKDRGGRTAERDILAALPECQLLTSFVHDAAARILKRQFGAPVIAQQPSLPESDLSERENECLWLAALGKTIPEIAMMLPITRRTVAFHLANARRKLGVTSLRHAVTKATSLGLVRAG